MRGSVQRALCGPLPATTGSASCRVTLGSGSHAITVQAGRYYTGAAETVVRVAEPKGRISAIGHTAGPSMVFAIDNRFAEIVYASGGTPFRISSDDVDSLGFSSDGSRAELRATADLWDHSRLLRPVRVGRGLTLQVSLTEGAKGAKDTIAVSLWDADTLVFSSPAKPLAGGFVTIR